MHLTDGQKVFGSTMHCITYVQSEQLQYDYVVNWLPHFHSEFKYQWSQCVFTASEAVTLCFYRSVDFSFYYCYYYYCEHY